MRLFRSIAECKKIQMFISAVMACAIAAVIFFFSSQTASVSGPVSERLTYKIIEAITAPYNPSVKEITEWTEVFTGLVRKMAHFSLYAMLGMAVFSFFSGCAKKERYAIVLTAGISLLYAVSDEIHQYFVPGRSCEIRDVFIDFSGIIAGIAFLYILKTIIRKFNKV